MSVIVHYDRYYNLAAIPIIRYMQKKLKYKDGSKRDVNGYSLQSDNHYVGELLFVPEGTSLFTAVHLYLDQNLIQIPPRAVAPRSAEDSSIEEQTTTLTETEQ